MNPLAISCQVNNKPKEILAIWKKISNRISLATFWFRHMATIKILIFKSISSKIYFTTNILGESRHAVCSQFFKKNCLTTTKSFTSNIPSKNCLAATKHFATNILCKNHLVVVRRFVPKILVGKMPCDHQTFSNQYSCRIPLGGCQTIWLKIGWKNAWQPLGVFLINILVKYCLVVTRWFGLGILAGQMFGGR